MWTQLFRWNYALLLLFVFNVQRNYAEIDGCSITLPTDIPAAAPVFLTAASGSETYDLFKPSGEVTILPLATKLLLVCAGASSNVIESVNQQSLELKCSAGNEFTDANNVQYILNTLACKSIPTSDLLLTSVSCADDQGYIFEAGFTYQVNKFASLFRICYDNVTEHTFYAHNTLNGAAINFNINESTRRAFRATGMQLTTTATNTFYTTSNQITRFEELFGANQPYITSSSFLARGHLSPDADFIFGYEQLATYFYTNVAPEFQVVNAGNWLRVENLARSLAAAYGYDLEIYNGYMGILQLPNTAVNPVENVDIYLDPAEQFEAPEYYFKVIKNELTDAAVVMITLNNPFATTASEFCTNVCVEAGLNSANYADLTKGYTFCCGLTDFKTHFADLPNSLTATNLLTYPSTGGTSTVAPPTGSTTTTEAPVQTGTGCTITMPTDIPNPEPVYIVSNINGITTPSLLQPAGQVTVLPVGSELTLFCAGSGNTLEKLSQQTLVLTCAADYTFYSEEKLQTFTLSQLNCTRIPNSELLTTSEPCSDDAGYIFEAGFTYNNQFLSVFSICYNNVTENTLYSRNIINGPTQNYKISESTRRAFRADGMQFTTTATNDFYTTNNQIARFEAIFGVDQTYVSSTAFLARGHLAPDADFIFGYEQLATYFYTNVAPEFQVVNAGNWLRVENLARSLASSQNTKLLSYTSTLDLLQLPDSTNTLHEIYLDGTGNYIEVPKWYYKVLFGGQLPTEGLVLITLNNPYATTADVVELCSNVCAQYDISVTQFTDATRGYTYCCTMSDFRNAVSGLPTFDVPANWQN